MSSAALAREQLPATHELPIDALPKHIERALVEIREIESRRGDYGWPDKSPVELAAMLEQRQRLRDAKDYLIRAQALVYAYAKGPTP